LAALEAGEIFVEGGQSVAPLDWHVGEHDAVMRGSVEAGGVQWLAPGGRGGGGRGGGGGGGGRGGGGGGAGGRGGRGGGGAGEAASRRSMRPLPSARHRHRVTEGGAAP